MNLIEKLLRMPPDQAQRFLQETHKRQQQEKANGKAASKKKKPEKPQVSPLLLGTIRG